MTRGLAQPFRLNSQFGVAPLHSTPSQSRLTAQAPARRLGTPAICRLWARAGRKSHSSSLGPDSFDDTRSSNEILGYDQRRVALLIVTGGERAQINCTLSDAPSFCKKPERLALTSTSPPL